MSKGSLFFTFLAGAAAGAVFGVLYAPDKGSNTRDRLSYRLDKYKRTLEELVDDLMTGKEMQYNEAKTHSQKVVSDAREKAERLLEDVDELLLSIKKDKKEDMN